MLSVLLAALDMSIVGTTLWVVAKDLDPKHGLEHLPWVVTTYTLAVTVTQPLYGKLCDLFGGKRVIMAAIGICVARRRACTS